MHAMCKRLNYLLMVEKNAIDPAFKNLGSGSQKQTSNQIGESTNQPFFYKVL